MRGHPAITVKWCLTGTARVVARGLPCAGPPRHNDGHRFSTRMAGADMSPDVCCDVRRRT
eukprot:4505524-Pyramimonas_sp.AAC.1